jgi:hypothetical protein
MEDLMELSLDQKREFHDSGFLVLPGAVSGELVGHARRAINHSMTMGEVGMSRDDLPAMRSQTYCREIRETAAVTDLPRADSGNFTVSPGDVVIAHHQRVHTAARNASPTSATPPFLACATDLVRRWDWMRTSIYGASGPA